MPVAGTRSLLDLAPSAPLLTGLETEPWELPRAQLLTLLFELTGDGAALLPPALHPSIPPTVYVVVLRAPESPAGPFTLAEVRIGCRAGARPRGLCLRAYCDSPRAIAELSRRWGFPLAQATVKLKKNYDSASAEVVLGDRTLLRATLIGPEPVNGPDIQFLSTLYPARVQRDGSELLRLAQSDPDFVFHSAERGRPRVDTFESSAWLLEGSRPALPVSATYVVAGITLPAVRFLTDPDRAPFDAFKRVD